MTNVEPAASEDPHTEDENPEEHLGNVIADPWTDDTQTDWPTEEVDI